jgi:Flp pilus assembly protein TadD
LLASKQFPEALSQAAKAVMLAPNSVSANVALGDVLQAMGRTDDARQAYQKALTLAQTVEPEFQVGWVGTIQEKLATK